MSQIKHVSFDVWNTLITANPEFAIRRKRLIADVLNIPEDVVSTQYTSTKKFVDTLAETDGIGLSTYQVYGHLIERLHRPHYGVGPKLEVNCRNWSLPCDIRREVEELFFRYPPTVLPSVQEGLRYLVRSGISISVASNSNFISGETVMRSFLSRMSYVPYKFMLFSDELGVAKPSAHFFAKVIWETQLIHGFDLKADQIIHVGDNYKCDGVGPSNVGMRYAIVANPNELPSVLNDIIKEHNNDR